MNRRYKSGTRWCAWRWTDVVLNGELYLRRLHLVQTPWFSLMLHWIPRADPQPDMHDHPVSFVSVCLRGEYLENRPVGYNSVWSPWFALKLWLRGARTLDTLRRCFKHVANVKRATDSHRIVLSHPDTLTLVLAGPVVRSWGFHTAKGWVPWREYSST